MYKILNKNISHEKLKNLSESELKLLCKEIRHFLIKTVTKTGGHLASNLGIVELSVAIHKVFKTPMDKIVFDVGHQSYTHKLLTGRFEKFHTLRQKDGISGFPRQAESEHDAFIGGHSGISISAALGIAEANRKNGNPRKTIAVAGDGSFTDGAIYEGLNNAGKSNANLLVILNDNAMSISKNTGAIASYLSGLRISKKYHVAKSDVKNFLEKSKTGEAVSDAVSATKRMVKNTVYYKNSNGNIFENLGFKYYGPIDGHNLDELTKALQQCKRINVPCLIHVKTKKGKGYKPAEHNSGAFHGLQRTVLENAKTESFSQVFGREIAALAEKDERILLVSAAMKYATGSNIFNDQFPERFYDCGIAEGHAVSFSSGLASLPEFQRYLPVFAVYSTFLQRGFDRLLHDCAIENQHIVLAIDRAGVVGEDGETHQGIFDVGFLSLIPNFTIFSPSNALELKVCLRKALYEVEGPVAVRYPRGQAEPGDYVGEWRLIEQDSSKLILTYGRMFQNLKLKWANSNYDLLQLIKIKPLPDEVFEVALNYKEIVFYEEGGERGGIGEAFLLELIRKGWQGRYDVKAVTDFIPAADINHQLSEILGERS
ncbi:MAG: 1-deoxy-D-xylulose-5-phosphate synthase [Oscillospiraceae bacterium]|nr:1-deoxy-D-xylulose-5-phosphate synthase [Oscillospiraceae bacterium]